MHKPHMSVSVLLSTALIRLYQSILTPFPKAHIAPTSGCFSLFWVKSTCPTWGNRPCPGSVPSSPVHPPPPLLTPSFSELQLHLLSPPLGKCSSLILLLNSYTPFWPKSKPSPPPGSLLWCAIPGKIYPLIYPCSIMYSMAPPKAHDY